MDMQEQSTQLTGILYDIQSFSVQDGPGVRTTAFFKGCPLRCPWCHSPESQLFNPQLSWMSMRCQGVDECRSRCMEACPKQAIELGELITDAMGKQVQQIHVIRDLCDHCGACCEKCYPGALSICGKQYTVDELTQRLLRDRKFYREDGGVTFSGGECLYQADFMREVMKRLKAEGIHIAVDTTGYAPWETIEGILPWSDLFLYDLKHMNSAKHKQIIGVPNERILENAQKLAAAGAKLQIRIPVIPQFNEDEDNIRETGRFCAELGSAVEVVQLLPYHNLGVSKYLRISDTKVLEATPPSDARMEQIKGWMEEYGLRVRIH